MIADLQNLIDRHSDWARKTFPDETLDQVLIHLGREVEEVRAEPTDIVEFADCGLLLLRALNLAGFTVGDLAAAMEAKFQRIQKIKTWVKTTEGDYQSVKEKTA